MQNEKCIFQLIFVLLLHLHLLSWKLICFLSEILFNSLGIFCKYYFCNFIPTYAISIENVNLPRTKMRTLFILHIYMYITFKIWYLMIWIISMNSMFKLCTRGHRRAENLGYLGQTFFRAWILTRVFRKYRLTKVINLIY